MLIDALLGEAQAHLFSTWPALGTNDADKQRMVAQLLQLDGHYHGGICAYIRNAKKLLKDSKEGEAAMHASLREPRPRDPPHPHAWISHHVPHCCTTTP